MNSTFKILLIEDDDGKRQAVDASIRSELVLTGRTFDISFANSVQSAIEKLRALHFDLLVADMSLPTYDIHKKESGGTPRSFGGLEVFDFLERFGLSTPVLVVTSYPVLSDGSTSMKFDDLAAKLTREFPSNFLKLIYFDSAYTDWDVDLKINLHNQLGKSQ